MAFFILRRVGVMALTALCLTFVVFFLTNLYPNLEKLAKQQGNARMTGMRGRQAGIERNAYGGPMVCANGEWAGRDAGLDAGDPPAARGRALPCHRGQTPEDAPGSASCCKAISGIPSRLE